MTDADNTYPDDFSLTVLAGTNYTVVGATITPAADFNGELTVPVKVNDGTVDSNTYNLSVTVTAANVAPVVSDIPDQTIPKGGAFATINLDNYVSDVDNTDAEMAWTYSGNYRPHGQHRRPGGHDHDAKCGLERRGDHHLPGHRPWRSVG